MRHDGCCYLGSSTAYSHGPVCQTGSHYLVDVTVAWHCTDTQTSKDPLHAEHDLIATLRLRAAQKVICEKSSHKSAAVLIKIFLYLITTLTCSSEKSPSKSQSECLGNIFSIYHYTVSGQAGMSHIWARARISLKVVVSEVHSNVLFFFIISQNEINYTHKHMHVFFELTQITEQGPDNELHFLSYNCM